MILSFTPACAAAVAPPARSAWKLYFSLSVAPATALTAAFSLPRGVSALMRSCACVLKSAVCDADFAPASARYAMCARNSRNKHCGDAKSARSSRSCF